MAVRYDLYDTPPHEGGKEKKGVHVRVVSRGLVTTEELAQKIQHESSLTDGDVEAVLSALSFHLVDSLSKGDRVHIKGLGYFSMVITHCPPETGSEIKGGHVEFKTIRFLPEKKIKENLKKTQFLRSNSRNIHSLSYSDQEIEIKLMEYFETHAYISRAEFQRLFVMTKSTATARINKLIENGKLKKRGLKRFPVYEP